MNFVLLPITEEQRDYDALCFVSVVLSSSVPSTRSILIRRSPMLFLPFRHRLQATDPLTEERMHHILRSAHCSIRYRFGVVLAVDRSGQHYYLCHQAQLATMTVQQFKEALVLALPFRLREPGHMADPFERDPA